jgi:hypothetical protein
MNWLKSVFQKIKSSVNLVWFFLGTLALVVLVFISIKLYTIFFKKQPSSNWIELLQRKLDEWNKKSEEIRKQKEQAQKEWEQRREEANKNFLKETKK